MTARAHAPSFLQIAEPDDAVFVINSFSKPWAMTGWRIGWLVHPAQLGHADGRDGRRPTTPAPTHFAQYGALAALSPQGDAFRGEMLARCRKGRDVVQTFHRRPEPHPLDEAGRRVLRLPACRRADGQPALSRKSWCAARKSAWRRARRSRLGDPRDESYLRICFAQDAARSWREGLGRASEQGDRCDCRTRSRPLPPTATPGMALIASAQRGRHRHGAWAARSPLPRPGRPARRS